MTAPPTCRSARGQAAAGTDFGLDGSHDHTVKKNAENATQASELASGTRDVADRGGRVWPGRSRLWRNRRILAQDSDIIGVIDDIAGKPTAGA